MEQSEINVNAFLKLLRYCEHRRDSDSVYLTMYGGGSFTDTSKHPNQANTKWGKTSTAAGAYQILYGTWKEAKDKGIVSDFSPESQDKLARWKLQTRHALDFVKAGDVESAVGKLRNEWTSLPGATESALTMDQAKLRFGLYQKDFQ
jgi:muramidase (phage lysozyme)